MTTSTQSKSEPRRRSSHLRSDQVIEIVIAKGKRSNGTPHPFLFDCWVENSARFLCTSRQPFLDAARALLALGCHPNAILVMRHSSSSVEALRASLQVAARLTVDECNGTRFARWKSFLNSVGSTRRDEAAHHVTMVSDGNLVLPSDVPSQRLRVKTSKSRMRRPKPPFAVPSTCAASHERTECFRS
jgi:hypothetical protein